MKKKFLSTVLAGVMSAAVLAGCGAANTANTAAPAADTAAKQEAAPAATTETAPAATEGTAAATKEDASAGEAGFVENEIFSDAALDFINLSAVWFQSVPMENETTTYKAEDADIHLEADISALENDLGYPIGDWVPYLTVKYSVATADGKVAAEGTFMPMAASDGPHYGNNIKLDPGTYNLTISISSPGEAGYLIHSDSETGPGGLLTDHFANGPLTYTFEGWEFAGLE